MVRTLHVDPFGPRFEYRYSPPVYQKIYNPMEDHQGCVPDPKALWSLDMDLVMGPRGRSLGGRPCLSSCLCDL